MREPTQIELGAILSSLYSLAAFHENLFILTKIKVGAVFAWHFSQQFYRTLALDELLCVAVVDGLNVTNNHFKKKQKHDTKSNFSRQKSAPEIFVKIKF